MGAVALAHGFLKIVTSAVTKPPRAPMPSQGRTTAGSPDSKNSRQGQIAVTVTSASRMAVLSTVPWMVITGASLRTPTPTNPPKDLAESAGLEVLNAALIMGRSLAPGPGRGSGTDRLAPEAQDEYGWRVWLTANEARCRDQH